MDSSSSAFKEPTKCTAGTGSPVYFLSVAHIKTENKDSAIAGNIY